MTFSLTQEDGVLTLELSGDIDLQITPEIRAALEAVRIYSVLAIDAATVTYMDSSGVAILLLGRKICEQKEATLRIDRISKAAFQVLKLSKMESLFQIGEIVDSNAQATPSDATSSASSNDQATTNPSAPDTPSAKAGSFS